jgi:hypothetical protein
MIEAGRGVKQCRQTFPEPELLFFIEEVKERGSVDGGYVPS